jgi:hypothetical protein
LNPEVLGSFWLKASATWGGSLRLKASVMGRRAVPLFSLCPGIHLTTEEKHGKPQSEQPSSPGTARCADLAVFVGLPRLANTTPSMGRGFYAGPSSIRNQYKWHEQYMHTSSGISGNQAYPCNPFLGWVLFAFVTKRLLNCPANTTGHQHTGWKSRHAKISKSVHLPSARSLCTMFTMSLISFT